MLTMTSSEVVDTSVTVTENGPFQDYPCPDNRTVQVTIIPRFKPLFFLVVLFVTLYKVVLTLRSVVETPVYENSDKS